MSDGGRDELYEVACATCGKTFDALPQAFCGCLVKERTLLCPACGSCFCRAPRAYREAFWSGAPQALWDRKMAETRTPWAPPPNPPPAGVTRPLVLVVDDEPGIQRLALQAVSSFGYGVVLAGDGAEGLRLAREYRPDLVLTDALMPKMDGREMCRRIKEDPATAGTATVVMTSVYTGAAQRYEAPRAFHVDEYLAKPLAPEQLRAVLERLAPLGGRAQSAGSRPARPPADEFGG